MAQRWNSHDGGVGSKGHMVYSSSLLICPNAVGARFSHFTNWDRIVKYDVLYIIVNPSYNLIKCEFKQEIKVGYVFMLLNLEDNRLQGLVSALICLLVLVKTRWRMKGFDA